MSGDKRQLSMRAVATGHVFWCEGMREIEGAICVRTRDGAPWLWAVDGDISAAEDGEDSLPDLDDHGTQGHFIGKVLPKCGYRDAGVMPYSRHTSESIVVRYAIAYRTDATSARWECTEYHPSIASAIVRAMESKPS